MSFNDLNRQYEHYQDQLDPAEREESHEYRSPEHRRRHLMQFIKDRNRKFYRDQRSRELLKTLYDIGRAA